MLKGACHCGAVQIQVSRKPRRFTSCNCSICRRYSALWAYYDPKQVRISAPKGATDRYSWGRKNLRFVRCATCGCVAYWEPTDKSRSRMGVNFRNFEPADIEGIRVRRLDGATTWKFLD
jgi:hypothetical protein